MNFSIFIFSPHTYTQNTATAAHICTQNVKCLIFNTLCILYLCAKWKKCVQNALFCVQNEGVCAKCVQMCAGCVQKFGFVCETQTSEYQQYKKMCAAVCKCVQHFARARACA